MSGFKHKCGVCLQPKEVVQDLFEVDTNKESWTCKLQFIVPEVEWLNLLKICTACTQKTDDICRFRRTCIKLDEERQQIASEYEHLKNVDNNYQSEDQTYFTLKSEQSFDNKQHFDDQTSTCSVRLDSDRKSQRKSFENQQHLDDQTSVCIVKSEEPQEISSDCPDSDNSDNNNCQFEGGKLFKNQQHLKDHTYFCRQAILNKHMQDKNKQASDLASHKDTKYTCDNCHEEYNGQKSFIDHLNKCEGLKVLLLDTKKVSFKCRSCCKSFDTYHTLKTHRKHCITSRARRLERVCKRERDPRFQRLCEICNKKFDYIKSLIDHCVIDHSMDPRSVKPFSCPHCPKRFAFSSNLVVHKRSHGGIRNITCSVCGQSFFTKSSLRLHETRRHLNERDYECDTCGKAFKTRPNLYSHKTMMHMDRSQWKHLCNICGRRFPFKTILEQHMRRHTGDKRFPCDICSKRFATRTACSKHMSSHADFPTNTPARTLARLFQCEHCGKFLKTKTVLERHLNIVHKIGDGKTFKRVICSVCSKSMFETNIKPHMRMHMGFKPVLCHLCGKKFTHKHNLNLHLKGAHSVEPEGKSVNQS